MLYKQDKTLKPILQAVYFFPHDINFLYICHFSVVLADAETLGIV